MTRLEISQKIGELARRRIDHAVATLVKVKGSAPQEVGAKLLARLETTQKSLDKSFKQSSEKFGNSTKTEFSKQTENSSKNINELEISNEFSAADLRVIGSVGGGKLELRVLQEIAEKLQYSKNIASNLPKSDKKESKTAAKSKNKTDLEATDDLHSEIKIKIAQSPSLPHPNYPCILQTWDLQRDIGMTCGGSASFLFEYFLYKNWQIALFGAGHIAQDLVPLLCGLDLKIFCFDHRADWLAKLPESPKLTKVLLKAKTKSDSLFAKESNNELSAVYAQAASELDDDAWLLSITQGHQLDLAVLSAILKKNNPPFFGVIGSKSKAASLKKQLRKAGVNEKKLAKMRCPLGLKIQAKAGEKVVGSSAPKEIAISIAAELLAVRDALV